MQQQIQTEIIIHASKETVYEIITCFQEYEQWNPFIVKSKGVPVVGTKLSNTMLNGEKKIVFKPVVSVADLNKRFEWLGSLFFKGLFDGQHYFIIEEIASDQINLIHGERFSGILSTAILKKIGDSTRDSFIRMNQALKERAETNTPNGK